MLTSEWKPVKVLHWGCIFVYISTGNEKLWIPSKQRLELSRRSLLKTLATDPKSGYFTEKVRLQLPNMKKKKHQTATQQINRRFSEMYVSFPGQH